MLALPIVLRRCQPPACCCTPFTDAIYGWYILQGLTKRLLRRNYLPLSYGGATFSLEQDSTTLTPVSTDLLTLLVEANTKRLYHYYV